MKPLRLLLSAIVILAALWLIVGEQMAGASADAVLNAPVVTVRADTAGDLRLPPRVYGTRVEKGEALASVTDVLVDTIRLNDLRMEARFATAETIRLQTDLQATIDMRDALLERSRIFRDQRLEEIRTRLDHARIRLAILEGGDFPDDLDQRLIDGLDRLSNRLPGEPRLDALVLDYARERVEVLEIALAAAQQGVFLGDGYNDSPNAEQRATELDSVIDGLQSQLEEARSRETAIAGRLNRERLRVNGLTGGEIASPVNGLFWEVLEADGVNIQRGDPILRLIDCDATIVTLSVTERIYNGLRIGQPADFRLEGSGEVYSATIARMAGIGAATIYENLAVAPSMKHLERFDVTLLVPGLTADPELGCAIGRTGRAFFDRRPLDWLRGWFS